MSASAMRVVSTPMTFGFRLSFRFGHSCLARLWISVEYCQQNFALSTGKQGSPPGPSVGGQYSRMPPIITARNLVSEQKHCGFGPQPVRAIPLAAIGCYKPSKLANFLPQVVRIAMVDSALTIHCGHWEKRWETGSIGVAITAAADDTDVAEIAVVGDAV